MSRCTGGPTPSPRPWRSRSSRARRPRTRSTIRRKRRAKHGCWRSPTASANCPRPEMAAEVKTVQRAQLIAAMEAAFAEGAASDGARVPEQREHRGAHRATKSMRQAASALPPLQGTGGGRADGRRRRRRLQRRRRGQLRRPPRRLPLRPQARHGGPQARHGRRRLRSRPALSGPGRHPHAGGPPADGARPSRPISTTKSLGEVRKALAGMHPRRGRGPPSAAPGVRA